MIHEKIRHLREQKKLRDEDMAERLGISQSTYSRLENGDIKMDVERLQKIADVLEVPVEELFKNEPVVFHVQNNSGGSNGWYNQQLVQQFPDEFAKRFVDLHESLVKELQQANTRYEQLTSRLLELLEKKI